MAALAPIARSEGAAALNRLLDVLGHEQRSGIAERVAGTFGTITGLLAASPARVARVATPDLATRVQALHEVFRVAARAELAEQPILGTTSAVLNHVRGELALLRSEHVLVIFLNTRHRLIRSEVLFRGTINQAPLHAREIVAAALEANAASVIVAHNHPSGDPTPSAADTSTTRALTHLLRGVGVRLLDHLVVGREGSTSLRELGLL